MSEAEIFESKDPILMKEVFTTIGCLNASIDEHETIAAQLTNYCYALEFLVSKNLYREFRAFARNKSI